MPLRVRLGLLFALATAALVGAVAFVFLLQLRASLEATLDTSLQSRAAVLADQYALGGPGALRLNQDEEPIQVLTADGAIVASSPEVAGAPVLGAAARRDVLARRHGGSRPLRFTVAEGDDSTRYLAAILPGTADEILIVGTGTDIAEAADERVEQGFLFLGPPTVLIAGLGAWWLAGAALRPVERMRRQTAELSEHDDGAHLAVPATRDEIAALARTMNGLLDRLRDSLELQRGFVADAGHELRTPLATLRAELELAARPGRNADELRLAVTSATQETERLIRLAEDLLLLARAEGDRPFLRTVPMDVTTVAAAAARGASARSGARDIDIVVEGPDRLELNADPDRLRQALDNVLANAVRHSPEHGIVLVTLSTPADGVARIEVTDQGPGFPEDFLPHAFERFRRADTARARADGGSGLGLAIVETIVRAHQGRVNAANSEAGGARVTLELSLGSKVPSPAM
ncbi:sensor histidine kinase [Actinomycetospora sp. CA-053990]|uniref:sensor histidine kinase n=1 Tax=Actinomycetospora sp. CA-053990 TaxID=3239891 RepID=UPI003D91EA37